jgi:hypothetical protein
LVSSPILLLCSHESTNEIDFARLEQSLQAIIIGNRLGDGDSSLHKQ